MVMKEKNVKPPTHTAYQSSLPAHVPFFFSRNLPLPPALNYVGANNHLVLCSFSPLPDKTLQHRDYALVLVDRNNGPCAKRVGC